MPDIPREPASVRPQASGIATAAPLSVREVLFGGVVSNARTLHLGLLLLRVIAGLALALAHGLGKVPPSPGFVGRVAGMGFPAPELFAWLAAAAEFGGGMLLAVGLLTRPTGLFIAGHMAIVTLLAHAGDPFADREKAVLFGAIALLYLLAGAGRYSLDALIHRRRP